MIAFRTVAKALLIVGGLALVGGCSGGGGADSETNVKTTTQGQELLDLKAALDAGALTQKEYDEQREKILDRD